MDEKQPDLVPAHPENHLRHRGEALLPLQAKQGLYHREILPGGGIQYML